MEDIKDKYEDDVKIEDNECQQMPRHAHNDNIAVIDVEDYSLDLSALFMEDINGKYDDDVKIQMEDIERAETPSVYNANIAK